MNEKILIVDDEEQITRIFKAILETEGLQCATCSNGEDAIFQIYENDFDLILLDIQMPGLNGFEVCSIIKKNEKVKDIPVLFLTGLRDYESRIKGLRVGANDFISKPVEAPELILRVRNMLKIREYSKFLKKYNETLQKEIDKKTYEIRQVNDDLILANEKIKSAYIDTVYRLSMAAEFKDNDTAEHLLRISSLSSLFTSILGMKEKEVERMYFASPMHDIGKIGISNDILLKASRLTMKEFEVMQNHTLIGGDLLKGSDSEILKSAASIAESHHEKYNGKGYPRGLIGDQIPFEGRIVMLIDIYDALRSKRPYKVPFSHEEALKIISHGDDRVSPDDFDPQLLEIFLRHNHDINNLYEKITHENVDFKSIFLKKSFLVNHNKL